MRNTRRELQHIARRYGVRAMNDSPFVSLPLGDLVDAEDEQAMASKVTALSYEFPIDDWRPIQCGGESSFAPRRFIDGSTFARTVAVFNVDGVPRPAVLACVGAMALSLNDRSLTRDKNSVRVETVLALVSNGIPNEDLMGLADALSPLKIRLIRSETSEISADFDTLRRRTWDLANHRMEECEREVLYLDFKTPTLVDGLLERRLTRVASHGMPVVGAVKKQMRRYLPSSHASMLYELNPGQRTPSFLLETEHAPIVSWYLRLCPAGELAPGAGIIRLTMPQEFLDRECQDKKQLTRSLCAVSNWICQLRHRESSYARMAVSLEPIVRLEDELHAVMPSVGEMAARLHRAMGI